MISDFNMIEDGDRVMVCVSGGKDSFTLLTILLTLQKKAPINFEIIAMNLDQKQPGFPENILPNYFKGLGIPFVVQGKYLKCTWKYLKSTRKISVRDPNGRNRGSR